MSRPSVCIVTPALASANNGNWQTARRWAQMLRGHYRVVLTDRWQGEPADVLVALHARRSAASIERWSRDRPDAPLAVVLTGTDLYRDIATDAAAQRSLQLADRLVVLHELACADLPAVHRSKCRVCLQSATARQRLPRSSRHLRALMVGHLREEKSPRTYFEAARRLAARPDIRLDHIGAALDSALGDEARALQASGAHYRWLGALSHAATRRRIQRAHVLVHPSRMEGGAHVVIEALQSGTPVLASRIAGNVGLLGTGYGGYFEPGDAADLAALLARCRDAPSMLATLSTQCDARAPLFEPARERENLYALLADLLENSR